MTPPPLANADRILDRQHGHHLGAVTAAAKEQRPNDPVGDVLFASQRATGAIVEGAIDHQRAMVRANLATILAQGAYILVSVQTRFVRCPNCKNETPERSWDVVRGMLTCGACKKGYALADNTIIHPQRVPISDVLFDRKAMPLDEQARILGDLLLGITPIVLECAECGAPKDDDPCRRVVNDDGPDRETYLDEMKREASE